MTVEALRQFMLLQGPSQNINLREWDSIWSLNKKVIDPVAPRLWAIVEQKMYAMAAVFSDASIRVLTELLCTGFQLLSRGVPRVLNPKSFPNTKRMLMSGRRHLCTPLKFC
jgi:hypothetical protein